MKNHRLPLRTSLLATGSVIGIACAGVLSAVPANAATTISFEKGVLKVVGDAGNNSFTVGRTPAGVITLNGAPVVGGAATVSNVSVVHLEGGAGNDTLRFDEANGPMPRGEFLGGDGRDAFRGGSAADTLIGGAGIDRGTGGPGDDTVSLGADADEFTWNVGEGNDHVDADAGADALLFNGNDSADSVIVAGAAGGRATVGSHAVPFGSVDFAGFEQLKVNAAGGADNVEVDDLAGTGLGQVRIGLDAATSSSSGDNDDEVSVLLGDDSEKVRAVGSLAAGLTVAGTPVPVLISGADKLTIAGGVGDDVIDASRLAAGAAGQLVLFGYSNRGPVSHGHDTLIGSPGDDLMFSFDDGGDRMEGRGGNDHLVGSPDSDQLFGGDGDDFLSGLGGNDVLDGGAGNNVIIP